MKQLSSENRPVAPRAETDHATVAVCMYRGEAGVALSAGPYTAVFLPELGMLGGSLTWHGRELLSLHGGLAAYRRRSSTGMPLLAPWANRLATTRFRAGRIEVSARGEAVKLDPNGLPIHGTMTGRRRWQVVRLDTDRSQARVVARFDYGAHPDLLAIFPFPHELEIDARVSEGGLRVTTSVTATTRRRVPVSFGWHPYFRPAGPRSRWRLRVPSCERLDLDELGIPTGHTEPQAAGTLSLRDTVLDDLYRLRRNRTFALSGGGLEISVRYDGNYPYAQLFAPSGKSFAAIEPMTAATNALVTGDHPTLAQGERYSATFAVSAR